jgi:hypothetical protein
MGNASLPATEADGRGRETLIQSSGAVRLYQRRAYMPSTLGVTFIQERARLRSSFAAGAREVWSAY